VAGGFAAERPVGRIYRALQAPRCGRRTADAGLQELALSSKRGQRHIDSLRRRLKTDLFQEAKHSIFNSVSACDLTFAPNKMYISTVKWCNKQ